jgi:hypothetical protein
LLRSSTIYQEIYESQLGNGVRLDGVTMSGLQGEQV